ncbi:Cell number regulator 5 [Acorus gramineus]|uniref:Cell number regulator 5 n=1 Tax=Acorus gramineus TaxID=55184 RepID=A0AAV9BS54_ACOGR|nr:Cell number regulator 5 [Acorus gramineus]
MSEKGGYVPPSYIPLDQSDLDAEDGVPAADNQFSNRQIVVDPTQWTSGICACCDDMQSCCIGLLCPCYLFGKNAEYLGSGTLVGSCMTHFLLWGLLNGLCCLFTEGCLLGCPGSSVACYAYGYRRALREKYNLQEAPCTDLTTHIFCHMCAICQEYREIRERSGDRNPTDLTLSVVTAPQTQTMETSPTQ